MAENTLPSVPAQAGPDVLAPFVGFEEDDGGLVPSRPWFRRPGVLAAIAAILIVALVAGFFVSRSHGQTAASTYTFATVTSGTLSTTVSATGALQSNLYDVVFQGTGTISAIDVTMGQRVQVGQVLAQMDPTSLRDALNQAQDQYQLVQSGINSAQTGVNNAQAGVAAAQTALDNANSNLNHVRSQMNAQLTVAADQEAVALNACDNPPAGTTSPPECGDQARNTYNLAVAQANAQIATAQGAVNSAANALTAAQGQVNGANVQVQSAQTSAQGSLLAVQMAQASLDDATIRAPRAGLIVAINGTVGGTLGSGAAGSNAFFQIADLSQLQVMADVNEADIGTIALGQTATFTVSAYRNRTFTGKIAAIAPIGVATQSVVTYPVQIDVDATRLQGANLLPGMTATVTITTAIRPKSLILPASALTFAQAAGPAGAFKLLTCDQVVQATTDAVRQLRAALQANSGLASDNPQPGYVVERAANGQFIAVPVVVGLSNGQNDVVVQGLQANDRVVIGRTNTSATSSTTATRSLFPFGGGRFGQGGNPGNGNPSGTPVTGRGGNPGNGQGGNLRAILCGTSNG